jgi:hypothetical protein
MARAGCTGHSCSQDISGLVPCSLRFSLRNLRLITVIFSHVLYQLSYPARLQGAEL